MSEKMDLAEKLKSKGAEFVAIFSALTDEQWKSEVYTDGEVWTVRNVLAHFVTMERGLIEFFEQIRRGGAGLPADFSIDRYNASQQQRSRNFTPAELLEQYKNVRANSIAWVSGLKDEELEIKGRHPVLGQTTIREMVRTLYLHNQSHYRDVRKVLK